MVRPYKNGGGGGKTAHSVPLPGGCSDRAAPTGGLPTPRTCLCGLRRRPGESTAPSSKGARMHSPGEPRALPSVGGGLPRPSKALVFAEPGGGAGPEGEVRTGAGPLCSLSLPLPRRHPRPLDGPTPWARRDAPRGSYNFPETSAGAGKLQRVPAARVPLTAQWPGAGLTAEEYVMGAFGSFPGPMAPAPPLPPLRSFGLAPALPRACIPRPTGQERIQMRRFRKAQLGTQRSVTVIWPGSPSRV